MRMAVVAIALLLLGSCTNTGDFAEDQDLVGASVATVPAGLVIAEEIDVPYDRDDWHKRWLDEDRDCQSARTEVLIEESLENPALSADGCKVLSGLWHDPYTGKTFTDPRNLDIDHVVPLKEAHESGGALWTDERRRAYANHLGNPNHLIAVSAGANRSKGAKDPAEWLPTDEQFHCDYVLIWTEIKEAWELTVDPAEAAAVREVLAEC